MSLPIVVHQNVTLVSPSFQHHSAPFHIRSSPVFELFLVVTSVRHHFPAFIVAATCLCHCLFWDLSGFWQILPDFYILSFSRVLVLNLLIILSLVIIAIIVTYMLFCPALIFHHHLYFYSIFLVMFSSFLSTIILGSTHEGSGGWLAVHVWLAIKWDLLRLSRMPPCTLDELDFYIGMIRRWLRTVTISSLEEMWWLYFPWG